MAMLEKALRVNDELAIAPRRGDLLDRFGNLGIERATWGDDGDAHQRSLSRLSRKAQSITLRSRR
jgi:hypothetical protein